jgi:hypothetical protein
MKKILLILSIFLAPVLSSAQTLEDSLPQFLLRNESVVGVIFSVKQAQKIDRDKELLILFKDLNSELESNNTSSLEIINVQKQTLQEKNLQIQILEDEILDFKKIVLTKDSLYNNMENDKNLCDTQSKYKDSIIKNKDDEIKDLKKHRTLLVISNVAFIILALIF